MLQQAQAGWGGVGGCIRSDVTAASSQQQRQVVDICVEAGSSYCGVALKGTRIAHSSSPRPAHQQHNQQLG